MALAPSPGDRRSLPMVDATGIDTLQHCRWSCGYECFHAAPNEGTDRTFRGVMERAVSRRAVLQGAVATLGAAVVVGSRPGLVGAQSADPSPALSAAPSHSPSTLTFEPITIPAADVDELVVAQGYATGVVAAWGDPLFSDAPAFDPMAQTAAAQEQQFGYNADYTAFLPDDPANPGVGVMWVNHEYTNPELMFPAWTPETTTAEHVAIELAAHGGSVIEIARGADGSWTYAKDGRNRRITATTPIALSGPAAGHALLQTSTDPTGTMVEGMLNNCAGGWTPWGTILTAEENFNQYFANRDLLEDGPVKDAHRRLGLTAEGTERGWERFVDRFDLTKEPNEPFRFGWIVEIDPRDPTSTPRKRTAMGRFKHEGATISQAADGRIVAYMGDDERFDYVYKFVSDATWMKGQPGGDLLDAGTLYVARFADDGTGEWLPMIAGEGPLTAENGFPTQAEVLINTRLAADLLEPTRMDRPEDIERSPETGIVYLAMTNNTRRGVGANFGIDAANPRAENRFGHIVELTEMNGDAGATTFGWDLFLIAGDPTDQTTYFGGQDVANIVSPISCPDNLAFDGRGNLWIVTDGQPGTIKRNDAMFAVATEGDGRGAVLPFLSVPVGAESASLFFSPDHQTAFVAVQHPGEGGTFEAPAGRWPDFDPAMPPRPGVVAAWRTAEGDKTIGV